MVHKISKVKLLTKKQLEKLEELINTEITSYVGYDVGIEDLEQMSNGSFDFGMWSERGEALSKEELKELKNILDRNLGKRYNFMYSTMFSPFESPHY